MSAIYNACSQRRKVPRKPKESVTVLIPTGGDPNSVKNWRAINLQDCIYKLYAALWATKITDWTIQTGVASKSQKGFMRAQRLPKHVREVIAGLYQGASFCISTREGCTRRIDNQQGVKQHCPLSPMLFNLATEPLLQRLTACNKGLEMRTTKGKPPVMVSHTAYADDLKTAAATRSGISKLHQVVEDFLQWTGLEANPSKCATLGWKVHAAKQQPDPVKLTLHKEILPLVKLGEANRYLRFKDALESPVHQNQILCVMRKAKKDTSRLLRSELLPWQKLDALRTFVLSRLEYHLRHCYSYKQHLAAFDIHVRAALKAAFKLPKSTVKEVMEVIKRAFVYTPNDENGDRRAILAYLNGEDIGCVRRRSKKVGVRSPWSELPGIISMSKTRIVTGTNGYYVLQKADGAAPDQKQLIRSIKQHIVERQRDVWKEKVDQGKSVAYQSADSNSFLLGPARLKPEEIIFAIRTRSAQLPTRAYLKRIGVTKVSRCRHCTADPESLAHILNHCPHNIDSKIKARHNKALEGITTAIKHSVGNRGKTLLTDSCPDDMETRLRPDIILRDERTKTMKIADVAVVFEDYKKSSLGSACIQKEEKYKDLKTHSEKRGYRVSVHALVYGSLGCIAQENRKVLTENLGIAERTTWVLQRNISTDCIRYSNQIWGFHIADNGSRRARGRGRPHANSTQ
ncbi:hypothetical protein ENH_00001690 [Eimeria necatrix]|uniref:Reverse transcriptase domain-containing protein n=1 Tax=Eimeria necatrix TaxID=51315 RepID=U6MLQ8_9EIME|nr:hypothetical protein ENH_00001690 [Eimeria necatrix]CDJ65162.1 hypothetical protein ENH_00001690 [Eimeria necatrix]